MATQGDLNLQRQYNALLEEGERLARRASEDQRKAFESVKREAKLTEDGIGKLRLAVQGLRQVSRDLGDSFSDIYESIRSIVDEFKNAGTTSRSITSESNKILSISRKLRDNEDGIAELNLNQLRSLESKAKSSFKELGYLGERLKQESGLVDLSEKSINNALLQQRITEKQAAQLRAYRDGLANDQFNESLSKTIQFQKDVQENLGITGNLLENLQNVGARAFGGIGINLGTLSESFKEARDDAKDMARQLANTLSKDGRRIEKVQGRNVGRDLETGRFVSLKGATQSGRLFTRQLKVIRAALPGIGKGVYAALTDPLTTITALSSLLIKNFKKFNEVSVEVSRLTGQVSTNSALLNTRLISAVDYAQAIADLTKITGFNAQAIFSENTLAAGAELKNMLGLSGEEAGNLAIQAQASGKSLDSNAETIVQQVNSFNSLNRSAVAHGVVLKDISSVSDGISASMGGQADALGRAAASARRLGIDLKELDRIASSLLDFESSIQNELEAQLLTGKAINLTKAREFALTNKLDLLGEELFKNSASLAEFSSLSRISQEGYAKALGMSRDQLARTAYLRALELGMTEEQAAAAASVNLEDMKRMTVQASIEKSLEKIGAALAPVLEMFANFVGQAYILYPLIAGIAGIKFAGFIMSLRKMVVLSGALAASSVTASTAMTVGLSTAAILAGIGAVYGLYKTFSNSAKTVDDGIFSSKGLEVRAPEGTYRLNPNDKGMFIAGTDLDNTSKMNYNLESIIATKLDNLTNAVLKGGKVTIDGNVAGNAMVMGSFKLN